MVNARLIAHGRLSWSQALPHLADCTCLWADLDGLHTDAPPGEAPIASHLWAWNTHRLLRARIDGDEVILAELHLTDTSRGDPVRVDQRRVPTWPIGEGRVSVDDRWRGRTTTLYEVRGLIPLTFVRLDLSHESDT